VRHITSKLKKSRKARESDPSIRQFNSLARWEVHDKATGPVGFPTSQKGQGSQEGKVRQGREKKFKRVRHCFGTADPVESESYLEGLNPVWKEGEEVLGQSKKERKASPPKKKERKKKRTAHAISKCSKETHSGDPVASLTRGC